MAALQPLQTEAFSTENTTMSAGASGLVVVTLTPQESAQHWS
jgi:hypothetical protein